jgi:hypothetical protein
MYVYSSSYVHHVPVVHKYLYIGLLLSRLKILLCHAPRARVRTTDSVSARWRSNTRRSQCSRLKSGRNLKSAQATHSNALVSLAPRSDSNFIHRFGANHLHATV